MKESENMSTFSESEDDPEVYESSGSDWNENDDGPKKRPNRRASGRLTKKQKVTHVEVSSEEEEEVDEEEVEDEEEEEEDDDDEEEEGSTKKSKKNGAKKQNREEPSSTTPEMNAQKASPTANKVQSTGFMNGGFLISKKDAQVGDASKQPCLWRIDGKALLQKYEPFEEDGIVKHRNTSIYTGWSAMDKDQYHPVTVKILHHQGQNMVVELNWEKLKEINNDSE